MTHHIRQYHLHLALNGTEADGLTLHRQLAGLCAEHLLPALAQVLDRCAPPERHLTLDRLDIEAGPLSLDRLEQDAPAAIAQAVEKALREQTAQLRLAAPLGATDAHLKTGPQTVEESFFYFLNTGRLPWAFRLPEGQRLESAVLSAWAAMAGPAAIPGRVRALLGRALAAARVRQRLVWQFSGAFRETVLAALWPESLRMLEAIRTRLREAERGPAARDSDPAVGFEPLLWETVLAQVAGGGSATAAELVRETWLRLPPTARPPKLAQLLEQHWPGSTRPASPANAGTQATATAAGKPVAKAVRKTVGKAAAAAATAATANATAPGKPGPSQTEADEAAAESSADGYYLDNAGLVLLHPFLPRFFEGLGLTENNQLLQPDRALSLLHFLATGQPVAPEHELTLPKLLCAVPLPQPVAADVGLTIAETDEAEALLRAVVQHWTALRSTAPDALRGTFLARPGKLSRRPDGDWLLQVEPLSYDILLDQLPWGIAMIQLPWMPQLLRVEWS